MDLLIRLLIWLFKEVVTSTTSETPQFQQPVASPELVLSHNVRQIAGRLTVVQSSARKQLDGLGELEPDLREHVSPVLRKGVQDQAVELERQGQRLLESIPRDGAQASFEHARRFAFEVRQLETVLKVTKELLRQRARESDRAVLGDADALAQACYSPILEFARHHQLPIASNFPMTLFYPGGTFIELAFIKQELAPIGLPENYRREPWWWPAIAHEIAHDFYASLPAIESELSQKLFLEQAQTDTIEVGTEAFDRFLYRIWLEEIFADAVGSLMIGPAYLRAMTKIFRNPGSPERLVTVAADDEGAVDVHPPRHLRVHITGRFLHRQGFSGEARQMVRAWDSDHGPPQQGLFVTPGNRQAFPIESLLALGDSIADGIYNAEIAALAGHRLADVPGLSFSALHVRRAEKARPRLAAGQPAAFDARALIAAATDAALDHPEAVQRISDATRMSIVGVGTGERPARVRALAAGAGFPDPRADGTRRIVEAMLLEEILERRGGSQLSRRTRS